MLSYFSQKMSNQYYMWAIRYNLLFLLQFSLITIYIIISCTANVDAIFIIFAISLMSDILSLVEGYSSKFEQCLLAQNPVEHAKTLPESLEKNLLLFLMQPHSQQFKQVLRTKHNIKGSLLEQIEKWKIQAKIAGAKNPQEINYLIEKFVKENQHAYNFGKPAEFHSVVSGGKTEQQQNRLPNKMSPLKSLPEWTAEQLEKNEDILSGLTRKAVFSITEDRLLKLKTRNKELVLSMPYFKDFSDKFVVAFMKKFYQQTLETNKNFEFSSYTLLNLSRSQFMLLGETIPGLLNKDEYIKVWFAHNFQELLEPFEKTDLSISEKDEKRKVLLKVIDSIDQFKTSKTKAMKNEILKQLLQLDVSREDVDKRLFIEYIKNNPNSNSYENQKTRQKKYEAKSKSSYVQQNVDMLISPQQNVSRDDDLIKNSVELLFKQSKSEDTLKQLQQYFQTSFLNKIYATVKLSQGGKVEEFENYLSPDELKKLKESREITILSSNKRKWKTEDVVSLKVRVKNVKDIRVQVYKLDLEKHFSEGGGQIDQTQNLSFLQPNSSSQFTTNNDNPYLVNIHDIKIEGVPQGRGVWIVELEGEGISSRAFIRKGAIASATTTNSVGTEVKFYDESGAQIKDYSIWMEGKKHEAQSGFTIPFGENDKSIDLILNKDGYAQKYSVYVPRESYSLNVAYIYNTQSFIVGSIAKVLLHPRLSIGFDRTMEVSLKLLEKVKILVTLTNNLGIRSTIDFDNVQFKSTEDYVLQFPIQSFTSSISISVQAKVKKYNEKQQNLTSNHSIAISLNEGSTNFIDLYLSKKSTGFYLYVLGKSGEPIPNTEVIIDAIGEGTTARKSQNLMTSKDGSVLLGELSTLQKITARVNSKFGVVMRSWTFNEEQSEFEFPQGSVYLQGQEIVLPISKKQKVQLWRIVPSTGAYAQNLADKITFDETKLTIKGLPTGSYALDFVEKFNTSPVHFSVINGKLWENEHEIYDQNKQILYEVDSNQNKHILLGEASFKEQQGKIVVQIPVRSTYEVKQDVSFRAHLLASNFVIPNFNGKLDVNLLRGFRQIKSQCFATKQSQFYNNKKLSEESSYAINRAKESKYIGNNLQKPRVFLKRLEVRDTTQSEEQLEAETGYKLEAYNQSFRMDDQKFVPSACPPMPGGYGGYGGVYASTSSINAQLVNPLDITTHNNFLILPGTLVSNQKGDLLKFIVPSGYSHFECYAFSKVTGVVKKYDYPVEKIEKKSLSHTGIEASVQDTAWTMSRQVYKVQKGQNTKVNRDSVWSAIGLSNVVGFAKIKGANLQDWVANWNTYSDQQKLKTYDQKVCHELNTYIKYNDTAFFDKIVKPFITNKVNKTFVDLCLLQSEEALKWSALFQYQLLNEFQKVLLVHQLVKAGRKQEAGAIVNSMQNINKANRKTFEQYKRQFDTVITAKLTEQALATGSVSSSNNQKMKKRSVQKQMKAQSYKPQMKMAMRAMKKDKCESKQMGQQCDDPFDGRAKFNQPFKQMEKTKQYTETTYWKMKYPHQSENLVRPSPFWAATAEHFVSGKGEFLSEDFMYLTTAAQFTLAACFIPNQKLLDYGLKNEGDSVNIEANSSFLIFVREVKTLPFEKKFGVLLNQRFFNPDDRYYYEEDGTRIEKQTEQFIVRRPYCLQTLITNTSGTKLELQLLIDIPEGSVSLRSHQNTQIQSINLEPYSTISFERYFYFPISGTYSLYPANACRGGSVISKSDSINKIQVLETETVKKLDTLENVLKSGQKQTILQYLQTKNIFDSKIFEPSSILWMLKQKQFYSKVIEILRTRKYYLPSIWIFGYYHNDLQTINEFEQTQKVPGEIQLSQLPILEYFPYYSSRAHKFLNENKSTIRNQQFKKTYFTFLFASLFNEPTSSRARITFIYYLLLQDRIDEAYGLLQKIDETAKDNHRLQFDYIQCFLDMYKGYPSFVKSRVIAKKYVDYPIKSWKQFFKEIVDTLKEYDSVEIAQKEKIVEYSTNVINQGTQIKVSIPAETRVEICLYDINLELYFSNFPFTDLQSFNSNIVPSNVKVYEPNKQSREEKLVRDKAMKDCFVEVFSSTSGLKRKKVASFLWNNPSIKIKVKEDNGYAQVFYESKKQAGCYCKVYQMKNGESKFYRDGYTDITGTFKYALADLDGISQFAILFVTDFGGVVERVKPPSQQAYLA